MQFRFSHNNINVSDWEKSVAFYREALGLSVISEKDCGDFRLFYLGDGVSDWRLELTWLAGHPEKYDLGENEIHFCLRVDDYPAALALHRRMGCICYENEAMGLYFIEDPDGYWIEITPAG